MQDRGWYVFWYVSLFLAFLYILRQMVVFIWQLVYQVFIQYVLIHDYAAFAISLNLGLALPFLRVSIWWPSCRKAWI